MEDKQAIQKIMSAGINLERLSEECLEKGQFALGYALVAINAKLLEANKALGKEKDLSTENS